MAIRFKYDLATVAPPSNDLTRKFGQSLVLQQQRGNQIGKERALDRFGDANSDMTSLIQDTLESGDLDPQSVQQLQGLQAGRMTVLGGGFNETQQQQFMQGYNRQAAGLLSNVRRKPKPTWDDNLRGFLGTNYDKLKDRNWVPDPKGGFTELPDQGQPKSLWENPAALKEYRGYAGDMLRGVDGDGLSHLSNEEAFAAIDELAEKLYKQTQSRSGGNQPATTAPTTGSYVPPWNPDGVGAAPAPTDGAGMVPGGNARSFIYDPGNPSVADQRVAPMSAMEYALSQQQQTPNAMQYALAHPELNGKIVQQPTGMTPEELAGQQRLVNTMQGKAYQGRGQSMPLTTQSASEDASKGLYVDSQAEKERLKVELASTADNASNKKMSEARTKQMPNILRVLRDQGKFDDKQRQMLVDRYGLTQEAIAGLEAEESGRRQLSSTGQIINDGYVGDMRKSADDMASRTGRAQSFLAGDLGPRAPQADISGPYYRDPATGRPYDNRVGGSISLSEQAQDRLEKTWAETDAAGAKYKAKREGQRQGLKDRKTNPIADPKQLEKDARQFSTDYNLYRKGDGRLSVKDYIKQRAAAGTLSKDLTAQLQENYGLDLSSAGLQDVVTDGVDITSQKGVAMDAAASKRDARSAYRQQLKYGGTAPRAAQPQGQAATSVAGAQVASGGRSGNAVPPTAGAPEAPDFNWLKSKSANTDKDRAFYSQAEKIYQGASKEVQDAMGVLLNPKSSTSALLEAYEYLKSQKIDVDQFDPY